MGSTLRPLIAMALLVCAGLVGCSKESPDALIASAKSYLNKGDPKSAVIQLKNALQANPESGEARFLLGKAFLQADDPVSAAVELGKASRLKYPDDAVVPLRARALLQQAEAKKITEEYGATTLSAPEAVASLKTSLANAYLLNRDPRRADDALQDAFRAVPDYGPAKLLQARLQANQRDVPGALATVEQVLKKTPDDPAAWLLKGDLLLFADRSSTAALEAYEKALALDKDDLAAHSSIIAAYLSRNDFKTAKERLETLRKLRPNHPQTRYFDAQLAFQQGDYKRADELVQQLLKIGSQNPRVLQLAGAAAYQRGANLEAQQFLAKALNLSPDLPYARRLLAQTYARAGEPAKALATLEPLLEAGQPDAQTLSLAATAYLQTGNTKKAEEFYGRAVKLDPKDTRSRTALALTHLYADKSGAGFDELESIANADEGTTADTALINLNVRRKDFAAALKAVDRLEKKQPGKPTGPYLRGRVLLAKGDVAAARQSFERALAVDPVYFPAVDILAALDVKDNKPELAEQRFDKLLTAQPDNTRALMVLAQLRNRGGKGKEEVVALMTKAIKASPAQPGPRLQLVDYYLRQKDFKLALATAQEGIGAMPNSWEMVEALARAQLASGDYNQAITAYGKLIAMLPKSPMPHLGLADAYLAAGKPEDALRSLRQALTISPQLLVAQQKVMSLEMAAGRPSAAIAIARTVQSQRPTKAVGYALEAEAEATQKNWTRATALYRTAMQKEPESLGVAENLH